MLFLSYSQDITKLSQSYPKVIPVVSSSYVYNILGLGTSAAVNRRWQAAELDRQWRHEDAAAALARRSGWYAYRTGFGKMSDYVDHSCLCWKSFLHFTYKLFVH